MKSEKIKVIIITSISLIVFINFSGCEEIDQMIESSTTPDYILVTVNAKVAVWQNTTHPVVEGESLWIPFPGITVMIELIKAQGEKTTFYRTTEQSGYTETVSHTFKLYREQPIDVVATVVQGGLYRTDLMAYEQLTWDEVDQYANLGGNYSWSSYLDIVTYVDDIL